MKVRDFLRNLKLRNTKITLCIDLDNKELFSDTLGTLLYWVELPLYAEWFIDNIYCYKNHFVCFLVEPGE